jgi:hypothetical protein
MKKIYSKIAALALMLAPAGAIAQNLESGFFTDGYLYRHEMNPAIENSRNYVAMPFLGNINVGMSGNIGIRDVLFNRNGRTVLYTNPQVDAAEFMNGIGNRNRINSDFKIQLLGAGFKAWGGYNTIGINIRGNASTIIPKSIFDITKNGLKNQTYDISDLNAHAHSYAEIALGHSRKINEKWRVGAKFKFLLGAGNVDANVKKGTITLGENGYVANVDAELKGNIAGLSYKTKVSEHNPGRMIMNGMDVSGYKISGLGAAFDFGAEYKINDDWKVMASLTDLGFIRWKNNQLAATQGTVNTDDYIFNVDKDAEHSFSNEWEKLGDQLATLYELEDKGDQGKRTTMLGATMNIGGEYIAPFYRKLTFGLLNTTRINGRYSWTNFRLSANVAPAKCFSAGVNFAVGTFGTSLGWIMSVHPKGFNLFLGMDHTIGKLAKQGIPLSSNTEFNMGINFPF